MADNFNIFIGLLKRRDFGTCIKCRNIFENDKWNIVFYISSNIFADSILDTIEFYRYYAFKRTHCPLKSKSYFTAYFSTFEDSDILAPKIVNNGLF